MTDKPTTTPPMQPSMSSRGLVLPPNCRDVTAEKTGTVIGIIGATAAGALAGFVGDATNAKLRGPAGSTDVAAEERYLARRIVKHPT